MHVTFAENLDNNPSELLSLPDRSAALFYRKPTTSETVRLRTFKSPKTYPLEDYIIEPNCCSSTTISSCTGYNCPDRAWPISSEKPCPSSCQFSTSSSSRKPQASMATTVNESYDINAVELVPWLPTDRPTIKVVWVRVTVRVTHQDKLDSAENDLSMPFKVLLANRQSRNLSDQ